MSSLTKLGTALTVVFVVCVVALAAQILWVLLRSRKFRQRSLAGAGGRGDHESAGVGAFHAPPSKELLYFFCWNNQSRVEPHGATGNRTVIDDPEDDDGDELAKWQRFYGPPRLLFTINEEEREDAVDSDDKKRVCLRERLAEVDDEAPPGEAAAAAVIVEVDEGVTPFSTPCSSPAYFTPSPSPARDDRQAPTTVAIVLDGES
ncbi:uncharacterized protein LOC115725795 isoform X2 [Rhodamnia argentea]|uniref:Uncharacterized protein LOC115725795 isoform X2 n=1 Tax=Rhodamnia argentea TaxID=178133 RepID=A0A8B8MPR5_9MYRT|nr:uncharacterized protein LOC115725795 isoform X3 [Rhodamnia argentea]XP_048127272.1 uncharacterized protein LOC115725795 isoform X2 [Rhodamnia argentea]